VTASLPPEVQQVFDRFVTTEFTTVDDRGQPICRPVTPYYAPGDPCIDVSTAAGDRDGARDARANPKVALLFSEPAGSGMDDAPQVLVQGTAAGADGDVVHVRPERVYVWPDGDASREPRLYDTHMEEVRSGHDEEPPAKHAPAEGGPTAWDRRLDELGSRYPTAVLSLVAPDGFPFALRVPISVDREAHRIRIGEGALGLPVQPGLACVTAHDHHPDFLWQRNFQVRGDLVEEDGRWAVIPHKLVGGFELPPSSTLQRYRLNLGKMIRFRRTAKTVLRDRGR
jgi:Pyridoxamine 5'-phosphate oxidase